MAEQLDLATPWGPQTTRWLVHGITMERGHDGTTWNPMLSFIEVRLCGDNGQSLTHRWTGQGAENDIIALNKANLSTNSLQRRILNRLTADGVLSGTISGTAD